jgi:hypothetical protein
MIAMSLPTFNPPIAVVLLPTGPISQLGNNSESPSTTVSDISQVPGPANLTVP